VKIYRIEKVRLKESYTNNKQSYTVIPITNIYLLLIGHKFLIVYQKELKKERRRKKKITRS